MADSDKVIIIGTGENAKEMMYGTSVKDSPETSESTTNTFTGAVVNGTKDVSYTIEISKLRYEGMTTHRELSEKIERMMSEADTITIREIIRPVGERPYAVIKTHYGCITTGNDYEIKPDDHTVENLKFKSARRTTEWKELSE